ncbi:hypothetical protein ACOQFV_07270 [Nocardiopsis changdeensis]|uniref:HEAT repeat domain-containing protein n=1 Tax=Nocardiopsis changdeensis TaxID=2831969 RepID=A0ABX8BN93_9ACTN|nr:MULTISPECIES: hypothetical protein [Nocardiopsis]QUX23626.1 hypothetical protein KGD84_04500 [Nocardiopsis changdeensis]QYX39570.1 hypothetical protein K1J57_13955 [Nocardiopsis sp. MT53]
MWRWNPRDPKPAHGSPVEHLLASAALGTDPMLRAAAEEVAEGGLAAALPLLAESREDAETRTATAEVLGRAAADRIDDLGDLLDTADRADLMLWLGNALIAHALRASGGAAERKAAEAALDDARRALEAAADLRPDDAAPWVALQTVAMGAGADREEKDRLWDELRSRDPHLFAAHTGRVRVLSPARGGAAEEMFAFAGSAADTAPGGDPLPAVLALAHAEFLRAEHKRLRAEGVFDFVAGQAMGRLYGEAVEELFGLARAWAGSAVPHPRDVQAHHLFGWAFHRAGMTEAARWHLTAVGNLYCEVPWGFFGDARTQVARAMEELGVRPGGHRPPAGAG